MTAADGRDRDEGLLASLSTPPSRMWPDAVVHHGSRIALLLGLAALITVLFPPAERTDVARFSAGTVADETVQAQVPFEVPKSAAELRRDREEAAASVPPTFERRAAAADSMAARLERFFRTLDDTAGAAGTEGLERVLSEAGIAATDEQVELMADSTVRERMEAASLRVARELVPRGVVDASQAGDLTTDRITLRDTSDEERSLPRDSLLVGREFLDRATTFLAPATPDAEGLFRLILIRFVEPSYTLDVVSTELDKEAARLSVPTTKEEVLAGQVIVRQGDPIGEGDVERLDAYTDALASQGMLEEEGLELATLAGAGGFYLLLLTVFGLLLYFFQPDVYANYRWLLLQALLVATYVGVAAVIAAEGWPAELLPIAFVALAVAVLWDGRLALALAFTLAVLTGALPPFADYRVVGVTLLGGAAAGLSVRAIRRRAQTWVFVAVIAAAYAVAILSFALMRGSEPTQTAVDLAWAVGNGTASAILAMGFVPVFEWFTGITTDQTLLEWADPNRPLLKRLSLEAPGTWAHTINVANIAEAAATAIGANALLCRVGMYYHDIGKMLRPQYFVENQPGGRNPHDKLKPDTSASIVREHVVEGLRMAREEGVPEVIAGFIPEHHGTQMIGFFFEKAKEEYGEDEIDPTDYRYPGPKPRTRETAIAMLADSVESATRALQDPTAERTRGLVANIVDGKIEAGQLDEAPLTLREIATLKEQLAKMLAGMYHHRIDYPATRHLTEAEGAEVPAAPPEEERLAGDGGGVGREAAVAAAEEGSGGVSAEAGGASSEDEADDERPTEAGDRAAEGPEGVGDAGEEPAPGPPAPRSGEPGR